LTLKKDGARREPVVRLGAGDVEPDAGKRRRLPAALPVVLERRREPAAQLAQRIARNADAPNAVIDVDHVDHAERHQGPVEPAHDRMGVLHAPQDRARRIVDGLAVEGRGRPLPHRLALQAEPPAVEADRKAVAHVEQL
jgi:hypothetical protein